MDPRNARRAVAAALSGIPDLRVVPSPAAPDQPQGPTVVLAVSRVLPADVACPYARTELDAWLVTGKTADTVAYDELDDALAVVLDAFDAHGIRWVDATPGVWNNTHPAYKIATEVYA